MSVASKVCIDVLYKGTLEVPLVVPASISLGIAIVGGCDEPVRAI